MATKAQKEELMEVLKFTPRTYKIICHGYGVEHVMGHVNQNSVEYLQSNNISWDDTMWMDEDEWKEKGHPLKYHPRMLDTGQDAIYLTDWSEVDNLARCWGVEMCDACYLTVYDENDNEVFQTTLDYEQLEDNKVETGYGSEIDLDLEEDLERAKKHGDHIVHIRSVEKGTFFEADINLKQPFDPSKLFVHGDNINNWCAIVTEIMYDGESLDNYGGDTSGKSFEVEHIDLSEY